MAWTKTTTTAVVIGAVILAGGTTALVVKHQHQPAIAVPVGQKAGASMNFATPQDTFQSWLGAMKKGDLEASLASYTPEGQVSFMQTAGKGKSKDELVAMNTKIAGMIGTFQIVSNEVVSADESILHAESTKLGKINVPMKQIAGEWKINGNIVAGAGAK